MNDKQTETAPSSGDLEAFIKEKKFNDTGALDAQGQKTIKELYEASQGSEGKEGTEDSKKAYNLARAKLTQLCETEMDKERETLKMKHFSKEVEQKRKNRSIDQMEKEVRELEAKIEVIQLDIDEENSQIEALRSSAGTTA